MHDNEYSFTRKHLNLRVDTYETSLLHSGPTSEIGKWVAVKFDNHWYPGEVSKLEDDEVKTKCMKRIGIEENRFIWPDKDDISWFSIDNVVFCVAPPSPVNCRAFGLTQCDIEKVKNNLVHYLFCSPLQFYYVLCSLIFKIDFDLIFKFFVIDILKH